MVPLLFVVHPHRHGWRWAIMRATVEQLHAEPTRRCVNAGFADTRDQADDVGQIALYTVLSFAQGLSVECPVTPVELDTDPLPPMVDVDLLATCALMVDSTVVRMGEN